MARVIYGGGVSAFVGSIGGSTFQNNLSGSIVRQLPKIRKKRTNSQVNQLSKLTYFSQSYRELNSSAKADWLNYSTSYTWIDYFGREKVLTGLQWFNLINAQYYFVNTGIMTNPYGYSNPILPSNFIVIYNPTSLVLQSAVDFGSVSEIIRVFVSMPTFNQLPIKRKILRATNFVDIANKDSINITTSFEAATGLNYINDVYNAGLKVQVGMFLFNNPTYIPSQLVFGTS